MNKADLIAHIAKQADITKKAATSAVDAIVGAIHDSLKKKTGSIRISGLGTFKVVHKKARAGFNPQTGQKIKIPAAKVPRFTAAKALKEAAKKAK
jgi:DNA-binding protein HU-beta